MILKAPFKLILDYILNVCHKKLFHRGLLNKIKNSLEPKRKYMVVKQVYKIKWHNSEAIKSKHVILNFFTNHSNLRLNTRDFYQK